MAKWQVEKSADEKPDEILKGLSPEAQALFATMQATLQELKASREAQPMAMAQAQAKVNDPSNKVGPEVSVFNPRGQKDHRMPVLKCEIWAPWRSRESDHSLDREEVELFNLLQPGEYVIELVDGTPQKIVVIPQRHTISGEITRLTLSGPLNDDGKATSLFTAENKGLFPAMRLMLREILGDAAKDVLTMKQEVALITKGELSVSVGA